MKITCDNCKANKVCDHNIWGFETCNNFIPTDTKGTWFYHSTTMMECSICGRHSARHRFEFCPHCGSAMIPKVQAKEEISSEWEQLTI